MPLVNIWPLAAKNMHPLGESIPFALSESDHQVYEPRAVPLGKLCGCICPGCRQPVIAKHCMAGKRAPHFAHTAGSDCSSGYETAVHLAAKQLIESRRIVMFPALVTSIAVTDATGHIHKPSKQLAAAGRRTLTEVAVEEMPPQPWWRKRAPRAPGWKSFIPTAHTAGNALMTSSTRIIFVSK